MGRPATAIERRQSSRGPGRLAAVPHPGSGPERAGRTMPGGVMPPTRSRPAYGALNSTYPQPAQRCATIPRRPVGAPLTWNGGSSSGTHSNGELPCLPISLIVPCTIAPEHLGHDRCSVMSCFAPCSSGLCHRRPGHDDLAAAGAGWAALPPPARGVGREVAHVASPQSPSRRAGAGRAGGAGAAVQTRARASR